MNNELSCNNIFVIQIFIRTRSKRNMGIRLKLWEDCEVWIDCPDHLVSILKKANFL